MWNDEEDVRARARLAKAAVKVGSKKMSPRKKPLSAKASVSPERVPETVIVPPAPPAPLSATSLPKSTRYAGAELNTSTAKQTLMRAQGATEERLASLMKRALRKARPVEVHNVSYFGHPDAQAPRPRERSPTPPPAPTPPQPQPQSQPQPNRLARARSWLSLILSTLGLLAYYLMLLVNWAKGMYEAALRVVRDWIEQRLPGREPSCPPCRCPDRPSEEPVPPREPPLKEPLEFPEPLGTPELKDGVFRLITTSLVTAGEWAGPALAVLVYRRRFPALM